MTTWGKLEILWLIFRSTFLLPPMNINDETPPQKKNVAEIDPSYIACLIKTDTNVWNKGAIAHPAGQPPYTLSLI